MTLFVRSIAALTVLLGLALMAVSAYAAREEASYVPGDPGPSAEGLAGGTSTAAAVAGATPRPPAVAVMTPTAAPTVAIAVPVPVDAAPVMSARAGRANLSPGPRIWRVPSVKPAPSGLARLVLGIPPDQLAVMQQVSIQTGIPWQIFAAIAKVESDFGRNMTTSSAGAIGYGQFLPVTWATYGDGGDPYDFRDVLPAMGRYLLVAGAPDDLPGAIFAYNHSLSYVALVLQLAAAFGYPDPVAESFSASADGLIWPVTGPISTYFAPRHQAIDIDQTAVPGAPVRAAHDGVVLFAGGDRCCSYGLYVIVVAPSGMMTLYAHLDSLAVSPGQGVRQGQTLGPVGCTGLCTGVHLHFELTVAGTRRDPLHYLP